MEKSNAPKSLPAAEGALPPRASRRPVAALLFDHDGTVVDSLPVVVRASNAVLREQGLAQASPETIIAGMIHPTGPRLGLLAGTSEPGLIQRMARRFDQLAMEYQGEAVLYPGMAATLEALAGRGLVLGVVSNSKGLFIRTILERLGVARHFRALVGEDDMPAPKPDPRGLRAALAACGAEPGGALYVGDSATDLATARAAGLPVIGVTWGAHTRAELAGQGFDALVDRPEELVALASEGRPWTPRS